MSDNKCLYPCPDPENLVSMSFHCGSLNIDKELFKDYPTRNEVEEKIQDAKDELEGKIDDTRNGLEEKIREAAEEADAKFVPKTRVINTVGPLSGGGALDHDLTLSVAPGEEGAVLASQDGAVVWSPAMQEIRADIRIPCRQNLTLYVRKDGSDSHDGLADTPAGAMLTINGALNRLYMYDLRGYSATIQVRGGTYTEQLDIYGYHLPSGPLTICGAPGERPLLQGPALGHVVLLRSGDLTFDGVDVRGHVAGGACVATAGGFLIIRNSTLTGTSDLGYGLHCGGGYLVVRGTVNITGRFANCFNGFRSGVLVVQAPVVFANVIAAQTAVADRNGTIEIVPGNLSGTVTGVRYAAYTGGGIITNAGVNYIPGTIAGWVDASTAGFYA